MIVVHGCPGKSTIGESPKCTAIVKNKQNLQSLTAPTPLRTACPRSSFIGSDWVCRHRPRRLSAGPTSGGTYTRVHGHGTYRLTAYAIVNKVNGKCATRVVPYAQTELLTATGPLTDRA